LALSQMSRQNSRENREGGAYYFNTLLDGYLVLFGG